MHMLGDPQTMQLDPRYDDVTCDLIDYFENRLAALEELGVDRARLAIDPGIGFGKALQHNLAICNRLAMLQGLGLPVLFAASRKRLIGALSNEAPAGERLGGSVALALHAVQQGAQMVRVHDVQETRQAIQLWRGLRDAAIVAG